MIRSRRVLPAAQPGGTGVPPVTTRSRCSPTRRAALAALAAAIAARPAAAQPLPPTAPTPLAELVYQDPFVPGAAYDRAIPTPDSVLGFPVGRRGATHAQIEQCFRRWAESQPERCRLVEYARTHEGRACLYLVISSAENIRGLENLKTSLARLADPRSIAGAEADELIRTIPGVAWLAFNIHGDENSPGDAALALAYHLLADTREETKALLADLVVIIDPLQNPDGRDRFLKMVAEHRGNVPSVDDQSLLHTGYFPQGRTNHYNFDLNRDWVFATQPETRGRIAALREWTPLLFTDGHEMSPQDNYLFSPPREPINTNIPETTRKKWGDIFARDHAAAFDRHGWRYYTGEWADNWFPGYSDAYASYRGAIGILTEQARIQEDGVRKQSGAVETYRESVHHNVVSSLANLSTLRANLREIYADYLAARREAVDEGGRYGTRAWAVMPTANAARRERFIDTLRLHGVEVLETTAAFTSAARDQLGREVEAQTFPAGTILIPGRQPEGRLAAAMLEFDPRMPDETLTDERRELLRFNRSKMYDITAWNLTMLSGLEAYEIAAPGVESRPAPASGQAPAQPDFRAPPPAAVLRGPDDRVVTAAARAMELGARVRVNTRDTRLGAIDAPRGSLFYFFADNPPGPEDPGRVMADGDKGRMHFQRVVRAANELGLAWESLPTGLAPGDLPDAGGEYFPLLERPRVAVLARGSADYYDFGAIRWTLDHQLGLRASFIAEDEVAPGADLRRYNVIIIPNRWAGALPEHLIANLKPWIENGGTLIAIGSSAAALAAEKPGLSRVRQLADVLTRLDEYALAVIREWEGRTQTADVAAAWRHAPPKEISFPWAPITVAEKLSEDELKRRNLWQEIFMPSGAILAARFDDKHWLTLGCNDALGWLPVPFGQGPILMTTSAVETPIRFGAIVPAPHSPSGRGHGEGAETTGSPSSPPSPVHTSASATTTTTSSSDSSTPSPGTSVAAATKPDDRKSEEKKPAARVIGFAPTPEGHELRLRMSGLLWPEAAHRIANAAYLSREPVGRGQIILFAASPTSRGSQPATTRIFLNAVILGPGLGASHPIQP